MMNHLVASAIRQRFLVLLAAIALTAAGIWSFRQLDVEAYPDLSETQVVVITLVPGHAAEEIERQVTVPVERALQGVPRAIGRRSRTIFGLSVVDITFEYGVDDSTARQAVIEKLRDVALPDGVVPSLAPPTTPAGELYRYVIDGPGRSEIELRELQDWVIAPRLLQVPGVGDVFAFGGLVKQYQIAVDPMALYRYGLTIRQIADAIGANNANAGGAMVGNGQQAMVVRGMGMIRSASDLEQVVVTTVDDVPVFVRDVATVEIGAAPPTGVFGVDARSGGVEGVVAMRRGHNPSAVLEGVAAAVDELAALLPAGVRMVPIYDRTELVNSTLATVSRTLAEGLLIVGGVLLVFLGALRAALLTAAVIPLSLLFAFICMRVAGIPANLLSLGALDFGIIVDGTLVMVVHVVRTLAERRAASPDADSRDAVRDATAQMVRPVFVSLVIIIVAYLPLFLLERVERRLFTPMAFTVCFALAGSLLLTMTLVPAMATYLFARSGRIRENPFLAWLTPRYETVLRAALTRSGVVVAVTVLVQVAALGLGSRLGQEFLPQLDEGVVWIRATLPPGVAIEKSADIASRMRDLIRRSPEVRLVSSQTGRQDSNTEPFGPNRTELLVALHPYHTWPERRSKAAFVEELGGTLRASFPGVSFSFTQPIIDMVTEAVTGSSADLAVILTGPDLAELRQLAGPALEIVRAVPGAADTAIEQDADQPQLQIRVDRSSVARYGLNVSDVQEVIELAIGGRAVSVLFDGDRRFEMTVRYAEGARASLDDIRGLLVPAPGGARIPLAQLAEIAVEDGASIVTRRENRRQVSVRTNIRGRDQGGFVREAQARLARELRLPQGYRIEWGGQFENLARASRRLLITVPLTFLIMLALLYLAFASTIDAGLVLLNVPFSMVGGVIALLARGIPMSVSAAVGFVSVFGVAIMTGVLFIAEVNRRRSESTVSIEDAVIGAARARFGPNLLLILVALLGMVPAAVATGIGSDIQRPMATVIVGGLASTLLLTLTAMPSLYLMVSRRRPPSKAMLPEH
jgi:cobalt-zinc-cadmium resistance protein CzcA